MSYLSFTRGTPIAVIRGGELDGEIVHLFDPDIDEMPRRHEQMFKKLVLPEGKLFPLPSEKPEQVYASGPNGSGKTYWASQWLKLFRRMYPDKPIYIFSDVAEDPLLDKIKGGVERIALDDNLIEDPIKPADLEDSVVVFDDIDSIADDDIRKAVNTLRDTLLKTSRHNNIYVICTNHLSTDYKNTRTLINECRSIVCFPKSGAVNQISRIFKDYCGMTSKQVEDVMQIPSRWIMLHKNYPMYICFDHGITLL